eukprot:4890451-Pleurochrysis_carterae.AAC.3
MAPPGYRILKVKPAPARDTASESQRTLWRMNPELDEPFDPARCLEMTDAPKDAPVDPDSVNTSNLSEHMISTPKTGLSQVGIGQKPSKNDPLGIANVTPEHLAGLIGNAQAGYSLPQTMSTDEAEGSATQDDPRNTEIFQPQNKAINASGCGFSSAVP